MEELHSLDPRRQELLEARFMGAVSGNTIGSSASGGAKVTDTRYYAITISHINTITHTCRFLLIPDTPKSFFLRQAHENDTLHTLLNSYV
jgi:hypothetical protein